MKSHGFTAGRHAGGGGRCGLDGNDRRQRLRLQEVRDGLADADPRFEVFRSQLGMFSPITSSQVEAMRRRHGVDMTGFDRVDIAGATAETIPAFAAAYAACVQE